MKEKLRTLLVCPDDKHTLQLKNSEMIDGEIFSGFLECDYCAKRYPIRNFIPRFVSSDSYVDNFSFEWNRHARTQLDSVNGTTQSHDTFLRRTGYKEADFKNKLVLDVGCGSGRFLEIAHKLGAEVVGIDLSFAVDAADKNLGRTDGIHIIQADIFHLPFREETFDHFYSIGVLHHTPNTRQAFECVTPLLKSGGKAAIWVYNNWGIYNTVSDLYRVITTKIPKNALYALCRIFVPFIYFFQKRGKMWRYFIPIPIDYNPDSEWRILNTFDWYSPKYQWKHTDSEVVRWFKENNFKDIETHPVPVSVSGVKK